MPVGVRRTTSRTIAAFACAVGLVVACGYSGVATHERPDVDSGAVEASVDAAIPVDAKVRRGCVWPTLQQGAPWPMIGGCVSHAGRSSFRGPHVLPRERWKADVSKSHLPVPSIGADDTIYVPADVNGIEAFSPDGGVRRLDVGGGDVTTVPAIARDGTLCVGAQNNVALLRPDGGLQRYDLQKGVDTSAVVDVNGNFIMGSFANHLVAFTSAGNFLWDLDTGGGINSSPAIGPNGDIYVGSYNDKLTAVAMNGTLHWVFDTAAEVQSSPVVADDGTIYIGTRAKRLFAIMPDGTKKWSWDSPGTFDWQSLPALGWDGAIYAATGTKVVALRAADGTELWRFDAKVNLKTSVVVDVEGTLYVGGENNLVFAISQNGVGAWELDVKDPPSGLAIGRDGTLYVTCDGNPGRIHALHE